MLYGYLAVQQTVEMAHRLPSSIGKQASRQAGKQASRPGGEQASRQAGRQAGKEARKKEERAANLTPSSPSKDLDIQMELDEQG